MEHENCSETVAKCESPTLMERIAMRMVLSHLTAIRHGRLLVALPDGESRSYGSHGDSHRAVLQVRRYRFFTRVLFGGEIGFGEAFTAGLWDSPDVVGVINCFIDNTDALGDAARSANRLSRVAQYLVHRLHANSIFRSRKNISAHYDLGNGFFSSFLDRSMMYSCAIFRSKKDGLERAQRNKIHAIIDKAGITAGDHVLEIGCGWGGFAIEAARTTGCRVTCITISGEQLAMARERIAAAGLSDRVRVEFCDYRAVRGSFDKIVSIEMLEAVGHRYLGDFFAALERCLAPSGIAVVQVITTPDHHYRAYCRRADWIQKYVFPGGHLPSLGALVNAMLKRSTLFVEHVENIGPHYATTLRAWRERFDAVAERLEQTGYDQMFQRLWRYYLSICEAGFESRIVNDLQIVLTRPSNRTVPRYVTSFENG
ncbi:MAG TPA: cyclopropane-fatty-acyl-phospholipid synthase family protein [Spirochaetota bacterium]|nr:cyclopropane-fatty-acyl-phospholipid synthase family protein [Spirochaetota bacterium]